MAVTPADRRRAPRGTKILIQAFFAALDDIPALQREAAAKAALVALEAMLAARLKKTAPKTGRRGTAARTRRVAASDAPLT